MENEEQGLEQEEQGQGEQGTQGAQQQQVIDPAVEQEAIKSGWVPQEEFKGDPNKWRPANEWVERGREFIPFIKAENRDLKDRVTTLNDDLRQTKDTLNKIVKVQSKYSDDFYDNKITDIRTRKRQAAEEQDWDTYDRLEKQESQIQKPEAVKLVEPSSTNNQNAIAPGMQRWVDENKSWFNVDRDLTEYAVFLANQMEARKDPLTASGREYELGQEVKQRLEVQFPDKFKNPNQERQELDESNFRGGDMPDTDTDKKIWNDLPDEAKKQCNALIKEFELQGRKYTKEQYMKDYFEEGQ